MKWNSLQMLWWLALIQDIRGVTQVYYLWNFIFFNVSKKKFLFNSFYRNYEHIVKAHQNNPQQGEDQVSDQVKFNIFQSIMDSLFQSFSSSVSMSSFQELSACVFSWIEEHCKPQVRRMLIEAHEKRAYFVLMLRYSQFCVSPLLC